MLNQPCQAHENQANLQEQMEKKDEDHAQEIKQFQRQLLEVLQRRPEAVPTQVPGTQIMIAHGENDPNALFECFRKMGAKELTGEVDPLAANDWLA